MTLDESWGEAYTMCMGLEDFEGAEKWAQRAYECAEIALGSRILSIP